MTQSACLACPGFDLTPQITMLVNAKHYVDKEVGKITLSIRLRCRISSCSLAFWKRACSLSSAEVSKYTSTSLVGRGVGGTEIKLQRNSLWESGTLLKLHNTLGRKPSSGPAGWTQFVLWLNKRVGCCCLPRLHFVGLQWAIFSVSYPSTVSVHANAAFIDSSTPWYLPHPGGIY